MRKRISQLNKVLALAFLLVCSLNLASAMLLTEDSVAVDPGMAQAELDLETETQILDESLAQAAIYFSRPRLVSLLGGQRKILLTFDDGPHPRTTPYILDILKKRNLRAVFFVLGLQAEKHPQILKRIAEEGHEIGNHSFNHKNLAQLSEEMVRQQIDRTNSIVEKVTGKKPRFLRPPYGAMDKQLIRICQSENMSIMLWTVDPKDWQNKNETAILRNLSRQLGLTGNSHGGAVLLHDIYPATVKALDPFLDQISMLNYQVATAHNFEGSETNSFWASTEPRLLKNSPFKRKFDPMMCSNKVLVEMLVKKAPVEISSMAMLKANRNRELLVFLARHEFGIN
ncbi:MAG: polysaccharide deacetylase family protein [Candidatus Rifleibacteriota bacterium]